ncbi:MAG: hypothetical protein ACJAZN_003137 [Planctomycetota bacterium]|jgi:hypothetical protein
MTHIKVQLFADVSGPAVERVFSEGRVVVGRGVDCDVVLDPRHTLTSGRHLALQLEAGTLLVQDLGSTNGTQVNGTALEGRALLAPGDRVTLGPDGPVLTAQIVQPGTAGAPRSEPRASVGLETMAHMVKATVRRERRRGYLLAIVALGVGAAGWHLLRQRNLDAAEMEAAVGAGMPASASAPAATSEEAGPRGFETVLASVAESVYVVVKRTEREGDSERIIESGSGTAWSIEGGLLGTNGHVAALYASLQSGETLVARSNAAPTTDLRIVGVRTHPGYRGFASLIERIRPYDKSSREVLDLPPAYDVALLVIHPDDVVRQAQPLVLASEATAFGLRAGQPIAFVGFPGEGLVRGGTDLERPLAKTAIGSLNRVIDPFFGRPASASVGHCLEYNIEVVGGASGSPIINADGEVIGLINAGDVLSQTGYGRVGTGGTSYGPRVDLMRALLAGNGAAEWTRLRPGIEARMLEIFRDGSLEAEEHAGQIGTALLKTVAGALDTAVKSEFSWAFKGRVRLDEPGLKGRVTLEVPVGAPGLRVIIAIAEGSPLGVRIEGRGRVDRGRLIDRVEGESAASTVDIRLVATNVDGEILRLDFRAEDDEYFAPGEMSVYVLRLD